MIFETLRMQRPEPGSIFWNPSRFYGCFANAGGSRRLQAPPHRQMGSGNIWSVCDLQPRKHIYLYRFSRRDPTVKIDIHHSVKF